MISCGDNIKRYRRLDGYSNLYIQVALTVPTILEFKANDGEFSNFSVQV